MRTTYSVRAILLVFLGLLSTAAVGEGGSTGGLGGDLIVQRLLLARLYALDILRRTQNPELSPDEKDRMAQVLRGEPRFSAPGEKVTAADANGRQVEVAARFDPGPDRITFNLDQLRRLGLTLVDATALYLHEAGYSVHRSQSMAITTKDLRGDIGYRLAKEELDRPDSIFLGTAPFTPAYAASLTPALLYEQSFDQDNVGMDFGVALRLCEQLKSVYRDRYFLTYCVFHEKNWQELHPGVAYEQAYQFLGYEGWNESSSASAGATIAMGIYLGSYANAQSSSAGFRPVIRPIYVPYPVTYAFARRIYGLRVYGLGAIDEQTPYKTLFTSLHINDGVDPITFSSRKRAYVACKAALVNSNATVELKYYRSECFVEQRPAEGDYYYLVKTKNPFL